MYMADQLKRGRRYGDIHTRTQDGSGRGGLLGLLGLLALDWWMGVRCRSVGAKKQNEEMLQS